MAALSIANIRTTNMLNLPEAGLSVENAALGAVEEFLRHRLSQDIPPGSHLDAAVSHAMRKVWPFIRLTCAERAANYLAHVDKLDLPLEGGV
jgi:hypothetical protein